MPIYNKKKQKKNFTLRANKNLISHPNKKIWSNKIGGNVSAFIKPNKLLFKWLQRTSNMNPARKRMLADNRIIN